MRNRKESHIFREILSTQGQIERLKEEFEAHPENYPPVSGCTYRIVVFKSDGTPMRSSQARNDNAMENSFLDIRPVPNGFEKEHVTFPLPQSAWLAYWEKPA